MAKHEEGCPGCAESHKEVLVLDVKDPRRPSNEKEVRGYMHCGLCVMEYKGLRAKNSPEIDGVSPGDYQRLEVGSSPIGLQVWCRRHDVNVLHVDFEGRKMVANMTRKAMTRKAGVH